MGGKIAGKSKHGGTKVKKFGKAGVAVPWTFTTVEAMGLRSKVRDQKRDTKQQHAASDFAFGLENIADGFREAGMQSTAKDYDSMRLYIDDLLEQVEEREELICDLRDAVRYLGEDLNLALKLLKKAQKGGGK